MKRWKITGANRETGNPVEVIVDAVTETDAVKKAGQTGMLISEVVEERQVVAAHRPAPPPMVAQPVQQNVQAMLPVMIAKAPARWGPMRITGLILIIVGVPMTCVFGIGVILIIVGIALMAIGD